MLTGILATLLMIAIKLTLIAVLLLFSDFYVHEDTSTPRIEKYRQ